MRILRKKSAKLSPAGAGDDVQKCQSGRFSAATKRAEEVQFSCDSSSNLLRGPLARSHSMFDEIIGILTWRIIPFSQSSKWLISMVSKSRN